MASKAPRITAIRPCSNTTAEQACDARVQAWAFVFDRYAKLDRRHTGHGDVWPGRPAQRPRYAKTRSKELRKRKALAAIALPKIAVEQRRKLRARYYAEYE